MPHMEHCNIEGNLYIHICVMKKVVIEWTGSVFPQRNSIQETHPSSGAKENGLLPLSLKDRVNPSACGRQKEPTLYHLDRNRHGEGQLGRNWKHNSVEKNV